jgi:hypothetical protein
MDLFEKKPTADPLPALSSTAETAPELIRPSLCVQAREGRLHVFLPYASKLADYLDLVAAVEDTCQYLHKPVWLEGYAPPSDPRLRSFSVTPDPGVLEVNSAAGEQLGRTRADQHSAVRGSAQESADRGKVRLRWRPSRHRRWQPYRDRRSDRAGQPFAASSGSAAQHGGVLAEPSVAVVSVFRHVCRPDQPVSARGRGAHGRLV